MKMSKKQQVLKHVHHFYLWQIKTNCIKLFSFLDLPISGIQQNGAQQETYSLYLATEDSDQNYSQSL